MSERNGDRARFQRLRKAGLRRRDRSRATYAAMKLQAGASRSPRDSEQSSEAGERLETLHPEQHEVVAK